MNDIKTIQEEIDDLTRQSEALYAEIAERSERNSGLRGRISTLRGQVFDLEFSEGKFALDKLTPETFAELMHLGHGAGSNIYSRLKEHVHGFDPHIRMAGRYLTSNGQNVFEVSLNYREAVTDELVAAAERVTALSPRADDGSVTWSIFDHRLSEDGTHQFLAYSDGTAEIKVTSWGRAETGERKLLRDVLTEIAESHWYEGGPRDTDWE